MKLEEPGTVPGGQVARVRATLGETVSDLVATSYRGGSLEVARTRRHVARAKDRWYGLNLVLAGRQDFEHAGQHHSVGPGELLLWASDRPCRIRVPAPKVVYLTLLVPAATLDATCANAARHVGRPLPDAPATDLLTHHLSRTGQLLPDLSPRTATAALSAAVDLLCAALPQPESGQDTTDRTHLYEAITAYIQRNLTDAALCVETIADAHGISPRTVYRLFTTHHQGGIAAHIRTQRLQAAHNDLLKHPDQPIAAIARRWGFTDPAHFTRAHTHHYGHSPRTARTSGTMPVDRQSSPG
ncbi:helix-turn-helix domain-containing protein [Streptomyces sp. NPDC002784]